MCEVEKDLIKSGRVSGFVNDEAVKLDTRLLISSSLDNVKVLHNTLQGVYTIELYEDGVQTGAVSFPETLRDGVLATVLNTLERFYGIVQVSEKGTVRNIRTDVYKILYYLAKRGISAQGYLMSLYRALSSEARGFFFNVLFRFLIKEGKFLNSGIDLTPLGQSDYWRKKSEVMGELHKNGDWSLVALEYFPDGSYCSLGHALNHRYTVQESVTGEVIHFGSSCVGDFFLIDEDFKGKLSSLHKTYYEYTLRYAILLSYYHPYLSNLDKWNATFLSYLGVRQNVVSIINKFAELKLPIPEFFYSSILPSVLKADGGAKAEAIENLLPYRRNVSYDFLITLGVMGYQSAWGSTPAWKSKFYNWYSLPVSDDLQKSFKGIFSGIAYNYNSIKNKREMFLQLLKSIEAGEDVLGKLKRVLVALSTMSDSREDVYIKDSHNGYRLHYKGLAFTIMGSFTPVTLAEQGIGTSGEGMVSYLLEKGYINADDFKNLNKFISEPSNYKNGNVPDFKIVDTKVLEDVTENAKVFNYFRKFDKNYRSDVNMLRNWKFLGELKREALISYLEKALGVSLSSIVSSNKATVEKRELRMKKKDSDIIVNNSLRGITYEQLLQHVEDGSYLEMVFAENFRHGSLEGLERLSRYCLKYVTGKDKGFYQSLWGNVVRYNSVSEKQAVYLDRSIKTALNKAKINMDEFAIEHIVHCLVGLLT